MLPDPSQVPHLRHGLKLAGILAPKQKVSVRLELCVDAAKPVSAEAKVHQLELLGRHLLSLEQGFLLELGMARLHRTNA